MSLYKVKKKKEEDLGRALVAEMLVVWPIRCYIIKQKYLHLFTKIGSDVGGVVVYLSYSQKLEKWVVISFV